MYLASFVLFYPEHQSQNPAQGFGAAHHNNLHGNVPSLSMLLILSANGPYQHQNSRNHNQTQQKNRKPWHKQCQSQPNEKSAAERSQPKGSAKTVAVSHAKVPPFRL